MKGLIVASLLVLVVACAYGQDVCGWPSCSGEVHTMCFYSATVKCARPLALGLTEQEKATIVELHNDLRQKVARGEEKRGAYGKPQPPAKYMARLEWDEQLAKIAQHWANQCNFSHDRCRDMPKQRVGQNLAIEGTTDDVSALKVEDLVRMWYDEVDYFDADMIKQPFYTLGGAQGQQIGHYTQFVWGETSKIGCGAVKYDDGTYNQFLLVCNYATAGNFMDRYIYKADGQAPSQPAHGYNSRPQRQTYSNPQHNKPNQFEFWNPFGQLYDNRAQRKVTVKYTLNGKEVPESEYYEFKRRYNL